MTTLRPRYEISKRMNPFYVQGDYDGDGLPDYAALVTELNSGKEGFMVCFSSPRLQPEVLGAGRAVAVEQGVAVDDFATIDIWGTASRCDRRGRDCLYLEKAEAGGGFFIWDGGKFTWRQHGI